MRSSRRYVLYESESKLGPEQLKTLGEILQGRCGKVKVIGVAENNKVAIVRTTDGTAKKIRETSSDLEIGEVHLKTALTSGVIGKLKKRAASGKDG